MASRRPANSRIRVLNLARDAGYEQLGGAERLVFDIVRGIDRRRFDSYLCTTRAPEAHRAENAARETAALRAEGIPVLTLDRSSSRSLAPWRRLYRLMRRERIDILHAHMPRAAVPGALLARAARVPVVISHEHGSILYGHWLRKRLDRHIVARLSDVVLAVSDWDRRNLIEFGHMPADRVAVFRHGIAALPAPGRSLRDELASEGQPLIGAIGRLVPVKGYDDLLHAVARLRSQGRVLRCAIAGVGPERTRLQALAAELGLADGVVLLGFRTDTADLLRAFDVLVMPSHSEGAPLAMIEGMAAGCAIVATAAGGVPELIEDGVNGLLVEPRAPEALAAGIARVLDDPALARGLGLAARERQRAELELDVMLERLQDLYSKLYRASAAARQLQPR